MALVSPYIAIVTLNVSGLNFPIKKQWVAKRIKKKQQQKNHKQNKTKLYTAYRKLTLALKPHIGSKKRDEKHVPCK